MKMATAIVVIGLALSSASALGETEWMGGARQWSVGFVGDIDKPYCRLYWDSEVGKTMEFRQSLTDIVWLVAKNTWDIPEGTKTEVTITDRTNAKKVPAEFFDKNTLRLWTAPDGTGTAGIKAIVRHSFSGTPDLQLGFAGDESDWTLPISRVEQLYSTYIKCLNRLPGIGQAKADSENSRPF
ncbi:MULTISPECIES: hypothetical protein [unclassified Sinorhizobium]|uniref:hypothetical protein n=1 Tax=unclassified Sinorhizobium TaxID=2613772 RepID=UPI003524041C